MEVLKIEVKKEDEWYDVRYAQRTSPTSTIAGMKRCSIDEVADYINKITGFFVKNQTRFK